MPATVTALEKLAQEANGVAELRETFFLAQHLSGRADVALPAYSNLHFDAIQEARRWSAHYLAGDGAARRNHILGQEMRRILHDRQWQAISALGIAASGQTPLGADDAAEALAWLSIGTLNRVKWDRLGAYLHAAMNEANDAHLAARAQAAARISPHPNAASIPIHHVQAPALSDADLLDIARNQT